MGGRKRGISHFILGAGALALAEGPLVAGVTAASLGSALIFSDCGPVSQLARRIATPWGAVALPAVAALADIKDLPAIGEPASALTQRDQINGKGLRRHASPGGLDNGKPSVSAFRRSTAVAGLLTVADGTLPLSRSGPCPSRQQHHTSVQRRT